MSVKQGHVIAILFTALSFACTTKKEIQPLPSPSPSPSPNAKQDEYKKPKFTENNPSANLAVRLSQKNLEKTAQTSLDTGSYKFRYLTDNHSGTFDFDNGEAILHFNGLPKNQRGDLSLKIYKAEKLVLEGELLALTLKPGENAETITLRAPQLNQEENSPQGGALQPDRSSPGPDANPPPSLNHSNINLNIEFMNDAPDSTQPHDLNQPQGSQDNYFEKTIKPIVNKHCSECHHVNTPLNLMNFPFLTNSSMAQSDIIELIIDYVDSSSGKPTMPPAPRTALSPEEIQAFKDWSEQRAN